MGLQSAKVVKLDISATTTEEQIVHHAKLGLQLERKGNGIAAHMSGRLILLFQE